MADFLRLQAVQAGYGKTTILDGIDLQVAQGEMIALLGPSGCGKTTLLNAICGFLPVQGGRIEVAGRDITQLPAEQREMAMVFQSYALWPHMTVAQNIGYGLKVRRQSRPQIEQRIAEVLALVNLAGYEDRPVTALSGGQRQRVALARALAIQPPILLLDEPLSNLDARIRLSVRHEIKSLQQQLGFTSLIVTHDREEAMVMADRIVVLNGGQIEQIGTPQQIYQQPASAFVADFMGADNRLSLPLDSLDDGCLGSLQGAINLRLKQPSLRLQNQSHTELFFRSEAARLEPGEAAGQAASHGLQLSGTVQHSAYLGNSYRHSVRCGEQQIQVDHPQPLPAMAAVRVQVPETALHLF